MKKCLTACLAVLVLALFTACSGQTTKATMPGIDLPLDEYNTKAVLSLYPGTSNAITNGRTVFLVLHNQTGNAIVFPNDFGIRIFEKQLQGWVPVENRMTYGDGEILLRTSKGEPGGLAVNSNPYVLNLNDRATIRIVVIGHVQGKPNETVGAFIDMEINP